MIKLIWDWNGTLLDDAQLNFSCFTTLQKENGIPPFQSMEQYRNTFCFPVQTYYEKAGFDFSVLDWQSVAHRFMELYMSKSSQLLLNEQALSVLRRAKRAGMSSVIISASRLENLKRQIEQYPLRDLIDAVYGIDDIYASSKEHLAQTFLATCLEWDQLFWIGDSLHDAHVAASIGAACVLVTTGHQSRDSLKPAGCFIASSLELAMDWIFKQCQSPAPKPKEMGPQKREEVWKKPEASPRK